MASATYVFTSGTILTSEVNRDIGELNDRFLAAGTAHDHNKVNSKRIEMKDIQGGVVKSEEVYIVSSTSPVWNLPSGSVQFPANYFTNGDMIEVTVMSTLSISASPEIVLGVYGSGLTTGTSVICPAGAGFPTITQALIADTRYDNYSLMTMASVVGRGDNSAGGGGKQNFTIGTNWIQTPFTLAIYGKVASDQAFVRWFVRKIPGAQTGTAQFW